MFAKGPAWTIAGTPSSVWIRFGFNASSRRTAIGAGGAEILRRHWGAVERAPDPDPPETDAELEKIARRREDPHRLRSRGDVEAGALGHAGRPRPVTSRRSVRSFTSSARRQVIVSGSMPSSLPWR